MSGEWVANTGSAPNVSKGTWIDLKFVDGYEMATDEAETFGWHTNRRDNETTITMWRLHCAENTKSAATKETNPKQIHGQSSIPLSLFSPLGTAYGSIGKLNGKLKYGLNNFVATPVVASIYVDATKRHLDKWLSGQELDDTDGVPHFAAALANIDILICARAAGTLIDDRPMSKGYFEEIEKLTPIVKALHELHKDKNPHHYLLSEQDGPI